MNTVVFDGRVGQDPETKAVGNDTLSKMSVAINDGTKDKPHTSWITVEGWGKTSDAMSRLTKGERVGVEGRLKEDQYVDKDGHNRSKLYVVAMKITYFGEGKRVEGSGDYSGGGTKPAQTPAANAPINDDDLPF